MLAVTVHLLFNLKSDCHCSVLCFEQVAETTSSETTEMLAASSPAVAQIDSQVTRVTAESVNSLSAADTETQRTGEEVLAEGLIPSDANGSLDDVLTSQPAAAEDPAATADVESPLLADNTEGGQAQNADPAAVSTSQTSDDAQLDPNSTAALIQVSRSSQLSHTHIHRVCNIRSKHALLLEFASAAFISCLMLLVQLTFKMHLRSTGLLHVRHCSMSLTCSIMNQLLLSQHSSQTASSVLEWALLCGTMVLSGCVLFQMVMHTIGAAIG